MKFIDWFAGIGGFRRGMELAGHECVGFCEFDKFAVASYTSMHLITEEQRAYLATLPLKERQKEILKEEYRNGEWYANDIRRVYAGDIPEADCWAFGFPCQDISCAGRMLGFTGNRSSLFFRVMYLLGQLEEEKKPSYLFIENVKNLLSVNGGWDFARLLIEMDRGGYDAEWQVLNSKYFGVPQNRERCFIIGHLRGRSTAKVFPVEGTNGADRIYGIGHKNGYRRNTQIFDRGGLTEALSTCQGGGREHHTIEVIGINTMDDGSCRTLKNQYQKNSVANFTQQGSRGATCAGIEVIGKTYERDNYGDNRNRILGEGGGITKPDSNAVQGTVQSGVITVGNTNPSGRGMNGNCYSSDGINPTLTCNKNEGNRVAIPVLTPERGTKRQNGRRFKEDGEEAFTLTGQDRHGVAIEVEPIQMKKHQIHDNKGYASALSANDRRMKIGNYQERTMVGYNATLKEGGGMTQTALALNARNYKGLSGSNQMMTAAAMCLQSTKGSDQKNETSQTVSNPEKTEDSAEESKREH